MHISTHARGREEGPTDAPRVTDGPLGAQGPGVERDNNTSQHILAGKA